MEKIKDIKLDKELTSIVPNEKVLYDAIILQRASLRQGTHSTKTRSEVSGGGRKPWRQKGTGHARQGSIRSVQWVGGGRYGTPVPRDYSKKQNRKENKLDLNDKKVLIVANELSENLILASRNIEKIGLLEANELNVLDLVHADYLLTTKEGLASIEEVLK